MRVRVISTAVEPLCQRIIHSSFDGGEGEKMKKGR